LKLRRRREEEGGANLLGEIVGVDDGSNRVLLLLNLKTGRRRQGRRRGQRKGSEGERRRQMDQMEVEKKRRGLREEEMVEQSGDGRRVGEGERR